MLAAREVLSEPSGVDARAMSLVRMARGYNRTCVARGQPARQSKPELERLAVGCVAIPKAVIDAEFDTHQSDDELACYRDREAHRSCAWPTSY
jgi:hypothetical protein